MIKFPLGEILRAAAQSREAGISVNEILSKSTYPHLSALGKLTRAATAPAATDVQGWAEELVDTGVAPILERFDTESVLSRLPSSQASMGRYGKMRYPAWGDGGEPVASWIAESAPIPVVGGALTSTEISETKVAVIIGITEEMLRRSDAAQAMERAALGSIGKAVDEALLSADAAAAPKPAGLFHGAKTIASTNISADLKAAAKALVAAGFGGRGAWIMSPGNRLAAQIELNGIDTPGGWPIITSRHMGDDQVALVDGSNLVVVANGGLRVLTVDSAAVNMETVPLEIADDAGVTAHPVRSAFQTDTVFSRLIWDLNWVAPVPLGTVLITGASW